MMSADPLPTLRRWLHALLLLGFAGTGAELILLSHYEDGWQIVPIALVAAALATLFSLRRGAAPVMLTLFRAVMALCVAAGLAGVALHYSGAAAFQREMDPGQSGWTRMQKALRAKAPPVLAPGLMAQLGLLGLIFGYRHPSERGQTSEQE